MKAFVVHDGEWVLRSGRCKASDFERQAGPGEYVIEGEANPSTHKIEDGALVPYTPPEPDKAPEVRLERDSLLKATDWTQLPDAPLTDAQKAAYGAYRQALRDLTDHVNFPNLDADDWPQVEEQ
jgi:hypothetical protein